MLDDGLPNGLNGPLRYLIGADHADGKTGYVTAVSYDTDEVPALGLSAIAYCNLFYEKYSAAAQSERNRYGPYLHTSATAHEYNEGQISPHGPGWNRNLDEQFARRKKQGFRYIELDNSDAYYLTDVLGAVARAAIFGLGIIAKNPGLLEGDQISLIQHRNVFGIIVEEGSGTCDGMDTLRHKAYKPKLPVWFVSYGSGRAWARKRTEVIATRNYAFMGVSYSPHGEYEDHLDILVPKFIP